jgi:hypothetical protein
MQVNVVVHCTKGKSLRDAVVQHLARSRADGLAVVETRRWDRNPGWTKVKSLDRKRGAVNIAWSGANAALQCRVVTRGSRLTSPVLGDFITYLMNRHRGRIRAITVTSA